MPALIPWCGLQVEPTEAGGIRLLDAGTGPGPFAELAVELGEGWRLLGVETDDEQTEAGWAFAGATAVVRFRFGVVFRLTVELRNTGPEPVSVPAPRLAVQARWPVQSWLAGCRGFVLLDAGRDDGRLLALVQGAGDSRLSAGERWLTEVPTTLRPAGDPGAVVRASWTLDWADSARVLTSELPAWWPDRTALADGDELVLDLPDAAVEAAGVHILDRGEAAVALTGRPGVHLARVHEARGTTDVHLWWAQPLREELTRRTMRVLEGDPRACGIEQAWILGRALGAGLRPGDQESGEFLEVAGEELAARSRRRTPMLAALLADQAARTGAEDLLDEAITILAGLGPVNGRHLAWLNVLLACHIFGRTPPAPPAVPDATSPGTLMAAAEAMVLSRHDEPAPPPAVWRALGVLGAGLPGDTVGQLRRANALAIAGFVPERWDFSTRWPAGLPQVAAHATRRLLAEGCPDEVFAWLLW